MNRRQKEKEREKKRHQRQKRKEPSHRSDDCTPIEPAILPRHSSSDTSLQQDSAKATFSPPPIGDLATLHPPSAEDSSLNRVSLQVPEQSGANCDQPAVTDKQLTTNNDLQTVSVEQAASVLEVLPVPSGYKIPKLPNVHSNTVNTTTDNESKLMKRKLYMKNLMASKRKNAKYKASEKVNEGMLRKTKRENTAYRGAERERETEKRKTKRENSAYRGAERDRDKEKRKTKRENSAYRGAERDRDKEKRKTKRENSAYRGAERERETEKRKTKRENSAYRGAERERETDKRKTKRENSAYRGAEHYRDKEKRKTKRENSAYRGAERDRDKEKRKTKRENSAYRGAERERETDKRKTKRENSAYRGAERYRDKEKRKTKRENSAYRGAERDRDKEKRKTKRENSAYRGAECERDKEKRKTKRENSAYRGAERERETDKRNTKRENSAYRCAERKRDNEKRNIKRENSAYRDAEFDRDNDKRRSRREDFSYRSSEQSLDTSSRKRKRDDSNYRNLEKRNESLSKKRRRQDCDYRETEKHMDAVSKQIKRTDKRYKSKEAQQSSQYRNNKTEMTLQQRIKHFHKIVEKGPVYICTSCQQLYYRHSVNIYKHENYRKLNIPEIVSEDEKIWICTTCKSYASKNKIPPMSTMNKMGFPAQGVLSDLNPLEQNLLAVRLPFMKIHEAPRGKQKFIRGNMVLVPADVNNTVSQLPRLTSNTATIKAKLKRKLKYKHHVYSVNIRPQLVRRCAEFLASRPLYKDYVTYNGDWHSEQDVEATDSVLNDNECDTDTSSQDLNESDLQNIRHQNSGYIDTCLPSTSNADSLQKSPSEYPDQSTTTNNTDIGEDDEWSEMDENEIASGMCDTMLSSQDFLEPDERDFVYNFAPGEGGAPVSVFLEKESEELAFPSIFCGERRPNNDERPVKVTYGDIVKSELRSVDRRAASLVENIFFKAKKIQMKILIDQTNILIRKVKTRNEPLTVKDIKGDAVNNLIYHDKAYKSLASIRGSPPYFEKTSKDLFAMIRQLGTASFFITLSAAETRWTHLLSILALIVDKKVYTEDEIVSLTWEDKCRLIQSDPVTCARHFDFQVNKFLHEFLLTSAAPVGQIEDYFYRVEYQNRGSPHIHMVVWCSNAPQYGNDSEVDICEFVDKYITCHMPDVDSLLKNLVELQIHRHSHTCQMKKKKKCRFGFPRPVLNRTVILEPLSLTEFSKEEISFHKSNWQKVYAALNDIDESDELTYEVFLDRLQLNEQEYICAIRSSIKRSTIFLKRSYLETRVNNYNTSVLEAWRANTDIQFVLDVYACATYVASYLTKSQRGMSELLRKATQEANQGNNDIRQQVKVVGNKFLNSVEISAQEAVYLCLQLSMKKASRHVIFVNTSPPEERVTLLKPKHILDSMDDEDEDIECNSLLSRYAERPKDMEHITLAEFASMYEQVKPPYVSRRDDQSDPKLEKLLPEPDSLQNEDETEEQEPSAITQKQHTKYRRRRKGNIIRSVHFNPDVDSEKYYRELLVLYYPWREEQNLKGDCETYCNKFQLVKDEIENCRKTFEPYADAVNNAQNMLNSEPDLEDVWNELAPGTEYSETHERDEQRVFPDIGIEDYNIGSDLGVPITTSDEELHEFHEMLDEPYRELMRTLNMEQTNFVNDTLHILKHSNEQIFRFLSGGAGVGKSFVVRALYQSALKYYNKHAGENFAAHNILLLAPTGKAAYHIHGSTIHNALKIPANNKLEYRPLRSGQLNTLRNQIGKLKLIFIDEISMVGFRMLNFIHQRMMEIMQSPKPFGGVSVVVVGDLFQLEPVYDTYAFLQPSHGFMPLATNLWTELFEMFELKQIMRQADSKQFAELLNRLREGNHTRSDLELLKGRIIDRDGADYPHHATHLMHTNEKVNAYNSQVIQRSPNQVFTIKAKDRVVGSTPPGMRKKILENFMKSHEKNCQLPNEVLGCKDIYYDLTVNLNTSDGLTNGASCKIIKIDIENQETLATGIIWVKFLDSSCGKALRTESRRLYKPGYDKTWTPLQPVVKEFNAGKEGQAIIQRYQFPLRPSHAKSIHRSQGDTLDVAVVDLTLTRQVKHIHYVALSRLQSLEGLHILNLQEDKIAVDKRVVAEMARLRASPLTLRQPPLSQYPQQFKLVFLNARSLHRHIDDARNDKNVQSANVACFSETRFYKKDSIDDTSMKDFSSQYRQDCNQSTRSRPPYGLAVYSKSEFIFGPIDQSRSAEVVLFSVKGLEDVRIVFIYKPPQTNTNTLIEELNHIQTTYLHASKAVISGDFNIDWCSKSHDKQILQAFMEKHSYTQILDGPTNDFNSTIDLIFTNIENCTTGVLETYYTDHRLCWIGW